MRGDSRSTDHANASNLVHAARAVREKNDKNPASAGFLFIAFVKLKTTNINLGRILYKSRLTNFGLIHCYALRIIEDV